MNRFYFLGLLLIFSIGAVAQVDALLPFPAPSTLPLVPSEHLLCQASVRRKSYTCDLTSPTDTPDNICECVVGDKIVQGFVIYRRN